MSVWIRLDFASVFHMAFVYSRKKRQWQKSEKKKKKKKSKILPTYLSYFFWACNPSAVPRRISILLNQY